MIWLIVGLVLFLGAHSVRIFAEEWRTQTRAAWGELPFKGAYTVVSVLGFAAIIVGYGEARLQPWVLWTPPIATRHVSILLMLFASVLLVSAYVPRNHLKLRLKHPMVLSVKVWALSHLLANGNLADVILFGSFLTWAVFNFRAARARDRLSELPAVAAVDAAQDAEIAEVASPSATSPNTLATLVAVGVGCAFWALFTFVLHAKWIGVAPLS
jgi:uncharacterized membrane protein